MTCARPPAVELTLSIEEETLRRARVRAAEEGASVNAVVRGFLESYAAGGQAAALSSFLSSAAESRAGSGGGGRSWTRDELYAERICG